MATDWQVGDRLPDLTQDQERWTIRKILGGEGKSGMGIVYVVYDETWNRIFAAKSFQEKVFAGNPKIADRFVQEAHAWINLGIHRNVTRAEFVQRVPGRPPKFTGERAWLERVEARPFLFLEYVSGGDLGDWIGSPQLTRDLAQVLRFGVQFCDGMIHACLNGVKVHRDVKPQNCLITEEGALKVTDFGLAKTVNLSDLPYANEVLSRKRKRDSPLALSQTGRGAGTAAYMAPEQFADAKHVDIRADIYSFGVMLYQMLTGELPFQGRSWDDYARMHEVERLSVFDGRLSIFNECLQTCMAKSPNQRFATFDEVRDNLSHTYEKLTGLLSPKPVESPLSAADWSNKGVGLFDLGQLNEALACFEKALELNPRLETAWVCKGSALARMGLNSESLACYERALQLSPQMTMAWYNRGLALDVLGRSQEALASYDRAARLGHKEALFMANTHRKMKKWWSPQGMFLRVMMALTARRGSKKTAKGERNEEGSPTAGVPRDAAERFMKVAIHYQLRALVDEFPVMRSERYLRYLEDYWSQNQQRPEFNTFHLYKARWIRNCYPGPALEVCESFRMQVTRAELYLVSVEAALRDEVGDDVCKEWTSEVSGAFRQAKTLEEMRIVAMNYPILLRPAIQGGIDSQIDMLSRPNHPAEGREQLALLQQLREEVERRPIKSWWRPGGDPDPVSDRRSL